MTPTGVVNRNLLDEKNVKVLFSMSVEDTSTEKASNGEDKKLKFRGTASTEARDLQGETLLSDGLDFSYFIKHGWFDDEHSKAAADGLGVPTLVEVREAEGKKFVYVEGYLFDTPENRKLHNLMKAVKKAGSRRLGLSVQGPVIRRAGLDGKTVAQAWIKNIAITRNPVNPETQLEAIEKALGTLKKAVGDESIPMSGGSGNASMNVGADAGYPVPTYLGGGKASALMKQELVTANDGSSASKRAKGKKMKKKVFTQTEWDGMSDEVKKSLSDAFEQAGVELEVAADAVVEPDKVNAPDAAQGAVDGYLADGTPVTDTSHLTEANTDTEKVDGVAKSVHEQADELVKALGDARDVLIAGGQLESFTADQVASFGEAISAHTAAINSTRDVLEKSMTLAGIQNERISGIEGKFDEVLKGINAALEGFVAAQRVPQITKSVTDAAQLQAVQHPNEIPSAGQSLTAVEAVDVIEKALKEVGNDVVKHQRLATLCTEVSINGLSVDKDVLEKAIAG
jgi:hypothetical protein